MKILFNIVTSLINKVKIKNFLIFTFFMFSLLFLLFMILYIKGKDTEEKVAQTLILPDVRTVATSTSEIESSKYIYNKLFSFSSTIYKKMLDFKYLTIPAIKNVSEQNQEQRIMYVKLFDKLLPHFLINDVKVNNRALRLIRPGSPLYIYPLDALEKSDAQIGYGIKDDIPEEKFSDLFDKESYGYDCGYNNVHIKNKKCHLITECISSREHPLDLSSFPSKKFHYFDQNLKKLGLDNKKIFVRMTISGSEPYVIDDVLKHSNNITGLAMVLYPETIKDIPDSIKMLQKIEKNFILVERNPVQYGVYFKCSSGIGYYTPRISLSYINKNLVDDYKIADNQSNLSVKWEGDQSIPYPTDIIKWKIIPIIVKINVEKFFTFDLPKHFLKGQRFNN